MMAEERRKDFGTADVGYGRIILDLATHHYAQGGRCKEAESITLAFANCAANIEDLLRANAQVLQYLTLSEVADHQFRERDLDKDDATLGQLIHLCSTSWGLLDWRSVRVLNSMECSFRQSLTRSEAESLSEQVSQIFERAWKQAFLQSTTKH